MNNRLRRAIEDAIHVLDHADGIEEARHIADELVACLKVHDDEEDEIEREAYAYSSALRGP